jgi:hypothetical protein
MKEIGILEIIGIDDTRVPDISQEIQRMGVAGVIKV